MELKILIVDDHEFYRAGLMMSLSRIPTITEIKEVKNGIEFIEIIKKETFDVVFMDINMPEMNGIEATKKATFTYPDTKIIALTMFRSSEYLKGMIEAGAKGYLLKDTDIEEFETAINEVIDGNYYYSKKVADAFNS